jgi:hypothetical protein
MSLATTTSNQPRLNASLFTLYQTYKRGTTVLIDWLVSNGIKGKQKISQSQSSTPARLSVSRVLDLAVACASTSVKPPEYIQKTFSIVLVNRRKIAKFYLEAESAVPTTCKAATERHRFFNETLAKAYDVLFPQQTANDAKPAKRSKDKKKATTEGSPSNTKMNAHLFDLLSDHIEQAPEYDNYELPEVEDEHPAVARQSTIEDDPLEGAIAIHASLIEIEAVISMCKNSWREYARGEMPLPVVGWMTILAQEFIRHIADPHDLSLGGYKGLSREYMEGRLANFQNGGKDWLRMGRSDAVYEFHELTRGSGLVCPFQGLTQFRSKAKVLDKLYMEGKEVQPLVKYFPSEQDNAGATKDLSQSALSLLTGAYTKTFPHRLSV